MEDREIEIEDGVALVKNDDFDYLLAEGIILETGTGTYVIRCEGEIWPVSIMF